MAEFIRMLGRSVIALFVTTAILSLGIGSLFGLAIIPLAAIIVLAHGLTGALLFLVIARTRTITFRDAAIAGCLIAILPSQMYNFASAVSSWGWPVVLANAQDPEVWFGEIVLIVLFGMFGILGATVFVLAMRASSGHTSISPKPVSSDDEVRPVS